MMLGMGNRREGKEKHVDRQQQEKRRSGGEFILGSGVVVVDGGRLGYMTFVSMVMVSVSHT